MRDIVREISELCDLIQGCTYEDFIKKVQVVNRIPSRYGVPSMIDFDYGMLTATIFNEEYVVGVVDVWDENGNWAWCSEISDKVYFKKD